MIDLADTFGVVTVVLEMLRERHGIGNRSTEMCFQVPYANRIGAQAGQQGESRWTANGLLAVGSGEKRTFFREFIEGRCDGDRVSVATQGRTQIVNADQEDIGAIHAVTGGRVPNQSTDEGQQELTCESIEWFHAQGPEKVPRLKQNRCTQLDWNRSLSTMR